MTVILNECKGSLRFDSFGVARRIPGFASE